MSRHTPRLLLLHGRTDLTPDQLSSLRRSFDLVDAPTAGRMDEFGDWTIITPGPACCDATVNGAFSLHALSLLDADGALIWSSPAFQSLDDAARRLFFERARTEMRAWASNGSEEHPRLQWSFRVEGRSFDALLVPDRDQGRLSAFGVVRHHIAAAEAARSLAIDEAGLALLQMNTEEMTLLNSFQRLKRLEEKIIRLTRELLQFEYFEVRHLSGRSNRLELVITQGLRPLKIGEYLYAEREHNGISGYVAATGRSYLCPDSSRDPLYTEGLDHAGSSLTVPLIVAGRVTGVLNAESPRPHQFTEVDRRLAERFAVYLALALNVLDMLVADRCATRENLASTVQEELNRPIERIRAAARELIHDAEPAAPVRRAMEEIIDATDTILRRVESCRSGTRSLLGVDQTMLQAEATPLLSGKRILIADDDEHIREEMVEVLKRVGCDVTACPSGDATIQTLERTRAGAPRFDLIVTDVNMPDRNGYEVFRAAKSISETLPVILMTGFGYDPHHSIVRASQEGLQCFLFKPFRAQQLLDEVLRALTPTEATDHADVPRA